jgi:DNA-binding response OmpR family regulator
LNLLVVEDEALISMDLEYMLEDLGHRVVGVGATNSQALGLLERLGEQVDAAVLDVNLGGTSSVPVAEALRARSIPFIVASGYERAELERLGFRERDVSKPYSPREIDAALKKVARKPQRSS